MGTSKENFLINKIETGKILIFSDLHLHNHSNSSVFLNIGQKVLDEILSVVKKEKIEMIFFVGDFFHKKNKVSTEALSIATLFFNELKKLNIGFIGVVGNHDFLYVDNNKKKINTVSSFNLAENIEFIPNHKTFKTKIGNFYFYSWNSVDNDEVIVEQVQKDSNNFLFGHLSLPSIEKIMGFYNEESLKNKISTDKLKKFFTQVFMGHYHKRFDKENFHIVGSPYQQTFNDVGGKRGYFILNAKEGTAEFHQIKGLPEFKIVKTSDLKLKEFSDIDKLKIKNSFVSVVIDEKIDNDLLIELKRILNLENYSVSLVYNYDEKLIGDLTEETKENIKTNFLLNSFVQTGNLKDFFNEYIGMFEKTKTLDEKINVNRLKEIVNEIME